MLDYFKEVRSGYPDVYNSEFVLWNNKEIPIESKSIFWKCLFEKGIYFVQDLLNRDGMLILLTKKCIYSRKINEKNLDKKLSLSS